MYRCWTIAARDERLLLQSTNVSTWRYCALKALFKPLFPLHRPHPRLDSKYLQ